MILIDLLRVFDILDTILLEKMKCIGFSDDTIDWFYSYLTNRSGQCLYRESSPKIYFRTFILHVIRFNKKATQQFQVSKQPQQLNRRFQNNFDRGNHFENKIHQGNSESTLSKHKEMKNIKTYPKIYLKIAAIHSRTSSTERMTVPEM